MTWSPLMRQAARPGTCPADIWPWIYVSNADCAVAGRGVAQAAASRPASAAAVLPAGRVSAMSMDDLRFGSAKGAARDVAANRIRVAQPGARVAVTPPLLRCGAD